uniref:Uncharacterized protein n=1 Tax=Glossina austeni TaxID=7395 RepID=A0A1A9VHC0_GLOAU
MFFENLSKLRRREEIKYIVFVTSELWRASSRQAQIKRLPPFQKYTMQKDSQQGGSWRRKVNSCHRFKGGHRNDALHRRGDLLRKVSALQQHFRFVAVLREGLTNKGLANQKLPLPFIFSPSKSVEALKINKAPAKRKRYEEDRQAIITNFDKMLCCMKITLLIAISAIAIAGEATTAAAVAAAAAALALAQAKAEYQFIARTEGDK